MVDFWVFVGWGGLTVSLNVSPLPRATCLISIINRVPSYVVIFVATYRNTRVTCENKIKGCTGNDVDTYQFMFAVGILLHGSVANILRHLPTKLEVIQITTR